MSREIKFRAKYIDSDDWIYGGGVQELPNSKFAMFHLNSTGLPTVSIIKLETIGQFTGLKDKNGVEIYEGDIVKWITARGDTMISFVEYNSAGGAYLLMPQIHDFYSHNREVIGSIYENPELLK